MIGTPEIVFILFLALCITMRIFTKKTQQVAESVLSHHDEIEAQQSIVVVTSSNVPNKTVIRVVGLVSGRSKHFGIDLLCKEGKPIVHTSIESSQKQAMLHLIQEAITKGANAIVDMKMSTTPLGETSQTRVMYTGTAVIIE